MVKKNFRMENQMERMIVIFMGMSAAFCFMTCGFWFGLLLLVVASINPYWFDE
jgi:uncharacterized membrane protein